jgi:hypothetical protein
MRCVNQRASVVKPLDYWSIFGIIEIKLNGFERVNIEDVVAVVEWRLLVVEGWEPHSFEMSTVPLLSTHSKPHAAPLCMVYGLNDARDLVHECDSSGDVIEYWNFAYLLPWEGDVLE